MASHRRVKDIAYDEDELYSDEDGDLEEETEEYTAEDKQNFANLTPVVRAHLEEAGLQASDRQIEEALWHYYWDVSKSVDYLKKQNAPKISSKQTQAKPAAQSKPKSKFDEAIARNATQNEDRSLPRSMNSSQWFNNIPWTSVPSDITGVLVRDQPEPRGRLLGGSSKLAKLAEERRRKAEAAKIGQVDGASEAEVSTTLSSLDRLALSKRKEPHGTGSEAPAPVSRKQYIKKKREESPPPPPVPEPEPEVPVQEAINIRATPSDFGRTLSSSPGTGTSQARMTLQDLFGTSAPSDVFQKPSPDDLARAKKTTKNIAAKPDTNNTPNALAKAKPPSQLPDAKKLWEAQRAKQRPFASFVVAGHVDHGKSTLMGRLLLDSGAVQQRDIDKFRKQAAEIGKESFALAWVMDTGTEERERGVTVDIAQHHFTTEKADFAILDAPGHRDFVPSMISGASMADIVVLVVDANQLESGLKGQTREHIQLAYGVGIRKVVVAINKLDAANPAWDQQLFDSVKEQIGHLLRQVGFSARNTKFVACSGLQGENVVKPPKDDSPASRLRGNDNTLVSALESFTHDDAKSYSSKDGDETAQAQAINARTLRVQVADVYRGGVQNPLSVSGRITTGTVVTGQTILILPSGDQALVKGIEVAGQSQEWAVALQIVTLHLDGDLETLNRNLRAGDLICATNKPATLVQEIACKVEVLDTLLPQAVELHYGRLHLAARVKRLVETLDKAGQRLKKSPRSVKPGQRALIEVAFDPSAALEVGDQIVLRSEGSTIAYGSIDATHS